MNYSTAVMLINPNIKAIATIYEQELKDANGSIITKRPRTIYKTLDPDIKKGDLVVVPTGTRHGFTVVLVDETDVEVNFESSTEIGWIVDKVSLAGNQNVLAEEGKWIEQLKASEKRRKREEIKKSMLDMYQDVGIDKMSIASMAGTPSLEHKPE